MKKLLLFLLLGAALIASSQTVIADQFPGDVVEGTTVGIIKQSDLTLALKSCYTLSVQALTSSPADGQTIYFGQMPKAPQATTAGVNKVYIRKSGTLKIANIYCFSGTAGSAEAWSIYIRVNNTTDYLIETISASSNERVFDNSSLNITLVEGNYFEIKAINPTWVTNPLTTIFGGYVYIE